MSDLAKPPAHKPKGYIVLDHSALADLLAPSSKAIIPLDQKMDDNQPRHVDWLVALSKQNIEIIIPEEIAFALGNVFLDGQDMRAYGPRRPNDDLREEGRIFLSAVGRGDYPNIRIMPVPDDAKSGNAELMRKMRNIHLGHDVPKEGEPQSIADYSFEFMKHPLNNHIIPDALRGLPKDVPLFLLHGKLDSVDFMVSLSERHSTIHKLNTKGMLLAIKKSGLLKAMGHSPTTQVEHIISDIKHGKQSLGFNVGKNFGLYAQDSSGLKGDHNDHPFEKLLKEIMQQQGQAEQPADWRARAQGSTKPGTGIAGF